jgi:hypothetical protein
LLLGKDENRYCQNRMPKIDFLKVEVEISKAVHMMFVKNLVDNKATISQATVSFFRLDDGRRPPMVDPVVQALEDLAKEKAQEDKETAEQPEKNTRVQTLVSSGIPLEEAKKRVDEEWRKRDETLTAAQPVVSSITSPEKIVTKEAEEKPLHPIFILRKHILWLRRKKVKQVYEALGTTEEAFTALKHKKVFSPDEEKQIVELLAKATNYKQELMKKLGIADDEQVIETQRKKHINKRFNVKETWLPLH